MNPSECRMPVASCDSQFRNWLHPYDLAPRGKIGDRVLYRPPKQRNPNLFQTGRVRIFYFYQKCSILTSTPAPRYLNGTQALFFFADLQNSNVKRLSCQIFRPAASILTAAVPYSDIPLPHRIRQGQQIVLQFIRIPINWRFILWNMGISGSQQRNRTSKGS